MKAVEPSDWESCSVEERVPSDGLNPVRIHFDGEGGVTWSGEFNLPIHQDDPFQGKR